MKRYFALAIIAALLSCATTGIVMSSPTDEKRGNDDAIEIKDLRDRIARLEARIRELEIRIEDEKLKRTEVQQAVRLQELQHKIDGMRNSERTVPATEAPRMPNAWGEGEINGVRYFIMPLGADR